MSIQRIRQLNVGDRVCYDLGNNYWGTIVERRDKLAGLNPRLASTKLKKRSMKDHYVYRISPDISPSSLFDVRLANLLWSDGDDPSLGRPILRDPTK